MISALDISTSVAFHVLAIHSNTHLGFELNCHFHASIFTRVITVLTIGLPALW